MKRCRGKRQAESKYDMKQLNFRDTLKSKPYIYLNEDHNRNIMESHTFLKEKRDSTTKGRNMAGGNK